MSRVSRLFVFAVVVLPSFLFGQSVEQNINMVAGTQWPHGDPYLQRQNEPSLAVSTRNPLHILALANDYRSVDIPFDSPVGVDSEERGDAWLGVFKSRNGGQTWWSDLLDGYPQQTTSTSPLHGFQAAADAVVRAGAHGMFYASGIVLNRDPNPLGGVFVTRFIDDNRTENGDPFVALGATMIDRGTSGQFDDKPWLAVGPGTGQCTVNGETFPAQNVYIAYTTFVGGDVNIRTKLMFARSTDCGATWSSPIKLSEGFPVNQGAQIVVSPTGPIYVIWRLFHTTNTTDALMVAKSNDNGQTFTKAATIRTINPFEQGTGALPQQQPAIRTNAYPAAAVDSTGRVYVVWADRGGEPHGDGRILMMYSSDGVSWTGPIAVDNNTIRGSQFMPTITVTGGRIVVGYYDLRDDSTRGDFTHLSGGAYSEKRTPVGDLPAHPELVFSKYLQEYTGELRRHTLDLRGTLMTVSAMGPVINGTTRLSRYVFGSRPGSTLIEQMQYNPPNLPMFRLGTAPFLGDYIDVAAYTPKSSPVYHFAWTDNRDVRPPLDGNWANYTPVFSPSNSSTPNSVGNSNFATAKVPQCVAGQTGMRNQNIYTTRVTDGVFAGAPGNAKPLGVIQRAFAVFVQNATGGDPKSFRLTATPSSGVASFDQANPAVPSTDVAVPAHASATRTVYVTSTDKHATVNVDVTQIDGTGNVVPGGLSTAVVLNPDVSNPDVSNPDVSNPDVSNPDVSNPDVSNPDVSNSEVHTPDVSNPDVSNPDVSNPDVSNPDVSNPDVSNPDVSNPDVSNPDVSNPDVSNPDVSNPDVSNSALGDTTDYTWTTHNKGNTTSGYTVKLAANAPVPDVTTQLIVYRIYQTPIANNTTCSLAQQQHSQILSNVINPHIISFGDIFGVDPSDASFYLNPGDAARITLRVYAKTSVWDPRTSVAPVVVSQAKNNIGGQIAPTPSVAIPPSMRLAITTTVTNDALVGQSYSTPLSATGGIPPYTWQANVPQGATFNGNVLTYNPGFATPGVTTISVTVIDAAGANATARLPVGVYNPLQITTGSQLGNTLTNVPFSTTLAASGGRQPYKWSEYKPASFPAWLTLDPNTGQLSGTPTVPGTYDINVTVDDSLYPTNQEQLQQFHLTVADPLVIATTSLPNAAQGFAYSTTLTSTGGTPPIHWSPVSNMPNGMTLSDDGTISGISPFTATPIITVRATDSNNVSVVSQPLTLTIFGSFCPGAILPLFDNFNKTAVSNGGVSPAFSTAGETYCLDSLITYHYNNANGATPGTIGLTTNCSTSCTILGPWQATGSDGQGGPNENWTAVPAPQLIVMNGTYNVADSDSATWSQNSGSGGFGFSRVWVKSAVPSAMVAVPSTVAAGIGQFVVFNLDGLTSLTGTTVTFTDQNNTTGTGFLFMSPSTTSRLWVQLPAGLTNGPLTAKVLDANGGLVASTTIVQSTTPGVPFIQAIRGVTPVQGSPCGNVNQQATSTITIGGTIAVAAFGTDTTGAEVQFTQGNYSRIVGTTCGVDSPSIGENAIIPVPSDLPAGAVNISIRTTVNGVTSGWSQPVTVTAQPQLF